MRPLCRMLGHRWGSDIDPECARCGYRFADDVPEGGMVHIGWGRYGYITPPGNARSRGDVEAALGRINSLPSWRP